MPPPKTAQVPRAERLVPLLLFTFAASFATILIIRGVYFFAEQHFAFGRIANLLLALGYGLAYIPGSFLSHALSRRLGERRLLRLTLLGVAAAALAQALHPVPWLIALGYVVVSPLIGCMWAIMESYVSAGRDVPATSRAIGRFNMTWSAGVPLAVAAVGPILKLEAQAFWPHRMPPLLFVLPGVAAVGLWIFAATFQTRPPRLPDDHPHRPDADRLHLFRGLGRSSRWTMVAGYAMTFILAPLMPAIFIQRLGLTVTLATTLAAAFDVARFAAFTYLNATDAWHGRRALPFFTVFALPLGFLAALLGTSAPLVVAGLFLCGLAHGLCYGAALYYALVVQNASVQAGGEHEGLIGVGFAAGPIAALIGIYLSEPLGSPIAAMLVGVAPVTLTCFLGGLAPLLRRRQFAAT